MSQGQSPLNRKNMPCGRIHFERPDPMRICALGRPGHWSRRGSVNTPPMSNFTSPTWSSTTLEVICSFGPSRSSSRTEEHHGDSWPTVTTISQEALWDAGKWHVHLAGLDNSRSCLRERCRNYLVKFHKHLLHSIISFMPYFDVFKGGYLG